jgi:DNA mismatch repair protein MLH1
LEPVSIFDAVMIGLEQSGSWTSDMMPKEDIAHLISELLCEKRVMIAEYFSIIVSDGKLHGLPVLLRGYVPNMNKLGIFLLSLGSHCDWSQEKQCFHDIATELSEFYQLEANDDDMKQLVTHNLFPAFKSAIGQDQWIENDWIRQIVSLPELYKIFERC